MKNLFLLLFVFSCAVLFTACPGKKSANTNTANTNTNAKPTPTPFEGDAQAVFNKGLELQKNDDDEAAVRAFEQVIKMDENFTEAYVRLGMSYSALGEDEKSEKAYKKAIDAYRKYVDKHPDDAKGYYYLGWAYSKNAKPEEAERALVKATNLQKDYVDALYELGMVRIKLAKYPEAVSVLKKVLELDPNDYRAQDALEKAEEGRKRVAEIRQNRNQQNKNKNKNENENANGNSNDSNSGSNTSSNSSKPKPPQPKNSPK
jgi:tetratricopeptide (TPR) repeat protein